MSFKFHIFPQTLDSYCILFNWAMPWEFFFTAGWLELQCGLNESLQIFCMLAAFWISLVRYCWWRSAWCSPAWVPLFPVIWPWYLFLTILCHSISSPLILVLKSFCWSLMCSGSNLNCHISQPSHLELEHVMWCSGYLTYFSGCRSPSIRGKGKS